MAQGAVNVKVYLNCDAKSLKEGITNIEEFKKMIEATAGKVEDLNAKAVNFAAICAGVDQVSGVVSQLQGAMKGLSDAYALQIEAETKLAVNMRNTMDAREEDIQSIKDLCAAQQEIGVIGDEVQLAGAQELATYLESKRALEQLIPVMNDMLAQQYGLNASQENAAQIATMLGKVMEGQTGALKRYGYAFDEAQEQVLKYGSEMERAAVLADVVNGAVGGMNAELAKTDAGKLKQLENTMGDWKEKFGKGVQAALPFVTIAAGLTTATAGVVKFAAGARTAWATMKAWNVTGRITALVNRGMASSATTAAAAQQGLNASYVAGTKAVKGFTVASRAAMAIPWIAAISAAVYAVTKLRHAFSKASVAAKEARREFDELTDATKRAERARNAERDTINSAADAYAKAQAEIEKYKIKIDACNGKKKEEKKLLEELNDTFGEVFGKYDTLSKWYDVLTRKGEAYCQTLRRQAEINARMQRVAELKAENIKLEEQLANNELSDEPTTVVQPARGKKWWEWLLGYSPTMDTEGHLGTSVKMIDSPKQQALDTIQENDVEIDRLLGLVAGLETGGGTESNVDVVYDGIFTDKINEIMSRKFENSTDYDDAIAELERLLDDATDADASGIKQKIAQLKYARDGKGKTGHDPRAEAAAIDVEEVMGRDLKCLADYDEAIGDLDKKLRYATAEERGELEDMRYQLERRRDLFLGVAEAAEQAASVKAEDPWADVPAPIEMLETQQSLNGALDYYRKLQQTQGLQEAMQTQKTIDALQAKLDTYQRAIDLAKEQAEVARLMDLGKAELTVEIKEMGMGELESRIRALRAALADTENPLTDEQREMVLGMVAAYESWRGKLVDVSGELMRGWDGAKSIKSAVEGVTDAFKGGHTVLEKTIAVVDGVAAAYQAINAISAVCQAISLALGAAKAGEAAAFTASSATEGEAAKEEAATFTQLAAAKIFAANAALGIGGIFKASAQVAAMAAMVKGAGAVTAFADGGIISGPTLALMGEYPSARRDPEVVAPLSRLRAMLDEEGGGMPKAITLRAKGGDLMAVLNYQRNKLNRIG